MGHEKQPVASVPHRVRAKARAPRGIPNEPLVDGASHPQAGGSSAESVTSTYADASVCSHRWLGEETGVVLPLVAISLLVFFLFAALTVDLGAAWAKRRTAQTSADTAVLAAAVEFQTPGAGVQDAVDQALDFANRNLDLTLTTAQWEACTDAESLDFTVVDLAITDPTLTPLTDCISFGAGGDEIRVKLPEIAVATTFARVAGFNSIDVTAAGNASIRIPGAAQSPPFVVLFGTVSGDQVCLRTSSAGADMPGQWVGNGVGPDPLDSIVDPNDPTQPLASEPGFRTDPCDENPLSSSEFFGTMNPYFYKEASASPPNIACSQPGVGSIDVGIADGIDHNLSTFEPDYSAGDPERIDGFGCPANPPTLWPNTMATQSGFSAQKLKCGLVGGGGGCTSTGPTVDGTTFEARLRRGDTSGSVSFAGQTMTNLPLWHYLLDAGPASCRNTYDAYNSSVFGRNWDYWDIKEEMIDCLQDWNPMTHGQLFSDLIVDQGRFAWIPLLAESSISTPLVHFDEFVPAWINGLYQRGISVGSPDPMCWSQAESASGMSGWYRHESGLPFSCGRSNQNVDRVSAIVFDCGMLSADLCDPDRSPPRPGGSPIFEILLTK